MRARSFNRLIDKEKYQVFLFTCPVTLPFSLARHPWFVINDHGRVSRWEVFWEPKEYTDRWGYLHKDSYPPTKGIIMFPYMRSILWPTSTLIGYVEGGQRSLAHDMARFIEDSPNTYKHCQEYLLLGPNSNTYAQWVLDHFPTANLHLPWNAFGKRYQESRYSLPF